MAKRPARKPKVNYIWLIGGLLVLFIVGTLGSYFSGSLKTQALSSLPLSDTCFTFDGPFPGYDNECFNNQAGCVRGGGAGFSCSASECVGSDCPRLENYPAGTVCLTPHLGSGVALGANAAVLCSAAPCVQSPGLCTPIEAFAAEPNPEPVPADPQPQPEPEPVQPAPVPAPASPTPDAQPPSSPSPRGPLGLDSGCPRSAIGLPNYPFSSVGHCLFSSLTCSNGSVLPRNFLPADEQAADPEKRHYFIEYEESCSAFARRTVDTARVNVVRWGIDSSGTFRALENVEQFVGFPAFHNYLIAKGHDGITPRTPIATTTPTFAPVPTEVDVPAGGPRQTVIIVPEQPPQAGGPRETFILTPQEPAEETGIWDRITGLFNRAFNGDHNEGQSFDQPSLIDAEGNALAINDIPEEAPAPVNDLGGINAEPGSGPSSTTSADTGPSGVERALETIASLLEQLINVIGRWGGVAN